MNFLELVQGVIEEAGTDDPDLLTDVTDPPNSHIRKCVNWVNKAWASIQLQSQWRFMIREGTFNTVADQEGYDLRTLVEDYRRIVPYTQPYNRRWIRVDGEPSNCDRGLPVYYVPYPDWAGKHRHYHCQSGQPAYFTVDPDDQLLLAPKPSSARGITFDYLKMPQVLAVNADEPSLPIEFHEMIVYRAVLKYAGYDEAGAQYQRMDMDYREMLQQMRISQLPEVIVRGNL